MSSFTKYLGALAVGILVGIVAVLVFGGQNTAVKYGGTTNYSGLNVAAINGDTFSVGTTSQVSVAQIGTTGTYSMTFNGITTTYVRSALVSGTTTPCVIQAPAATSSLTTFAFIPTIGTSTSATLTLATSTTPNATTSLITSATYVPTTSYTWDGSVNNSTIFPNLYVSVGLAAGTATGGFVMTGFCSATFVSQ